jgi:serine/threonine protein kinase
MASEAEQLAARPVAEPLLPPVLPAGTVLRGRFRLSGTFATDPIATIYRAVAVESGRPALVKIFHEVGRTDRGRVLSLHATSGPELRAESPGQFATVHEWGYTEEGRLFLLMEVVEGPTIAELLGRTPPLGPVRAVNFAMQIGEALEVARNLGLLTVRIAPGDVIALGDTGHVRVLRSDAFILRHLGLADQLSMAEISGGDPRYASPEELEGASPTESSVVYRFGVLLYELLAGRPPFEGRTPTEVRDQQRRSSSKRLRHRHRTLPAALDRLVSRMLSPDPMGRPADLSVALNELWDAAGALRKEGQARTTERARAFFTRYVHAGRWMVTGLTGLLIVGTVMAWSYLHQRPNELISVPTLAPPTVPPTPAESAPSLGLSPSDPRISTDLGQSQLPEPRPSQESPSSAAGQLSSKPDDSGRPVRASGSNSRASRVPVPVGQNATLDAKAGSTPTEAPREWRAPIRPAEAPLARRPAESADATDPAAIIDWLVNKGPWTPEWPPEATESRQTAGARAGGLFDGQ